MNSDCQKIKDQIADLVTGILSEAQVHVLEQHLNECATCRGYARALKDEDMLLSEFFTKIDTNITHQQERVLQVINHSGVSKQSGTHLVWRTIMKSPITKLAAAAVIIVAVALLINVWDKLTPSAYALDQTIKANHTVKYLNVSYANAKHENDPKEFWIECDESGRIKNARWHMPEWVAPEDGAKVGVWNKDIANIWFKKKNSLLIIRNKKMADQMLKLVQEHDPKLIVQRLYEQEHKGQVNIKIDEPADESLPIVITATYLPENSGSARREILYVDQATNRREILYVDQATKLVKSIELYKQNGDRYEHVGTLGFRDYNIAIDPQLFSLDDETPADVIRVDQVSQMVGLAQDYLSDEEIAAEVVRQFFEALINKDYEKAGILYGGIPAEKMQQWFGKINVVRIVSIEKPKPHPVPGVGGFVVPCEVELEDKDGNKSIWKPYGPAVRPVDPEFQPNRWNLHGGI